MSEPKIGDRVQIVEWAPEIDAVPSAFREWMDHELVYAPAVGRLELTGDRLGRPAYWVRLERQRVTWVIETASGDEFERRGAFGKERVVIVRGVVSLEPIEVEA